jgi:ribosomal protein S18 acetylase RimI-like enzyme
LALFLINLPAHDIQRRLDDVLSLCFDAMHYPRDVEERLAAKWLENTQHPGWQAVAAVEADTRAGDTPPAAELSSAPLLGVAYGYNGAPDQWWHQQVVTGLRNEGFPDPEITKLMASYFELTEIQIHPRAQGRGLGEALGRRLLADRREANVLGCVPEVSGGANRAWRLYRRLGAVDILRGYHFAGNPQAFAVLGKKLPL